MSIEEIKNIKKLQQMLKSEIELREYTYKCCQEAGKELAKHSFAWDGKEKNLVIQAMELNERFVAKEKECEELKKKVESYVCSTNCYKFQEAEKLKAENDTLFKVIEKVNKINKRLEAENERLQEEREKAKNYNLEYGQLLIKTTNKNNKLSKTLAEIKEIITTALEQNTLINLDKILQKINECEINNEC